MIAVNRKDRDGGGGLCRTDESKRPGRTPALEDKEAPRISLSTHRSLLAKLLQTAASASAATFDHVQPQPAVLEVHSAQHHAGFRQEPRSAAPGSYRNGGPMSFPRVLAATPVRLSPYVSHSLRRPQVSRKRRLPDAGELSYQMCDALTEVLSQGGTAILPRIAGIARATGDAFAVSSWCKSGAEAAVARPSPIARRASSSRTGLRTDPLGVEDGVVEDNVVGAAGLHLADLETPDRGRA